MNNSLNIYPDFSVSDEILRKSEEVMTHIAPALARADAIQDYNQQKMLSAFLKARVSESCFAGSTGYGYGDVGREKLDAVFADALGAQDALVRHNFVCGTHALTVALFGVLRPGDEMLCVTGIPYDTLRSVIGITGNGNGTLKEFGIVYRQLELRPDGLPDLDAIRQTVTAKTKMVYVQRSRGYALRPSLTVEQIEDVCAAAKAANPNVIVMVDNCYGEFTQKTEPTSHGADLMAGSLIKNPGGGIAPTGGYIAGRADLVESCSYRLTTPGLGKEVGCTMGASRELFMGAYNAPHITGEAIKTAIFAAGLFESLGYRVTPRYDEVRGDIIQTILLGEREKLIRFCKAIQAASPVDAFVTPEPWAMPGYDCDVIMAAGAFTLGASIELSADAPLRDPFAVWMQGAMNFHSGRLAMMLACSAL